MRRHQFSIEAQFHTLDETFIAAGAAIQRCFDYRTFCFGILLHSQIAPPIRHGFREDTPVRQYRIFVARNMTLRTRPWVIVRCRNETGANRILLHISDCRVKMAFIQGAGKKTPLPKVTDGVHLPVKVSGILHMNDMESSGKRILPLRDADQVDMVGHKAVCPDLEIALGGMLDEKIKVLGIILCLGKHRLLVVSPLCDMMRITDRYGSRDSRHGF